MKRNLTASVLLGLLASIGCARFTGDARRVDGGGVDSTDAPATCAAPLIDCAGRCVDLRSEHDHCGICGNVCDADATCFGGCCSGGANQNVGRSCCSSSVCGVNGHCVVAPNGWTAGYCIRGPCAVDTDCGPGGVCFEAASGGRACAHGCHADRDCRPGYFCMNAPTASMSVCFPDCRVNSWMCSPARCDATNGQCTGSCAGVQDCSDGSTCNTARQICDCTNATVCGPARACYTRTGACGCDADEICGGGSTCDRTSGMCR